MKIVIPYKKNSNSDNVLDYAHQKQAKYIDNPDMEAIIIVEVKRVDGFTLSIICEEENDRRYTHLENKKISIDAQVHLCGSDLKNSGYDFSRYEFPRISGKGARNQGTIIDHAYTFFLRNENK